MVADWGLLHFPLLGYLRPDISRNIYYWGPCCSIPSGRPAWIQDRKGKHVEKKGSTADWVCAILLQYLRWRKAVSLSAHILLLFIETHIWMITESGTWENSSITFFSFFFLTWTKLCSELHCYFSIFSLLAWSHYILILDLCLFYNLSHSFMHTHILYSVLVYKLFLLCPPF